MASYSANMNVMMGAARKAAVRLKRDYGEVDQLQVSRKGPADFVTAADIRTEKILRGELGRARPDFGFLMEESGEETGSDAARRWIVDPVDGTTNFVHGIAHFAISIALEEDGELTAGVVFDPINELMFSAEKGAGAMLNDRRIRVSARQRLAESLFATGIPFKGRKGQDDFLPAMEAVMTHSAGIRRFGSAALDLAYVAAGRYEGYWESGLQAWDIAAGIVLVREAGGLVSEVNGGSGMLSSGSILAATPALHGTLGNLVRRGEP